MDCILIPVPIFAFVYVPTRTDKNQNPNALVAVAIRPMIFRGALNTRPTIALKLKPPKIPTNAPTQNAKIPSLRAVSSTNERYNVGMQSGKMPTKRNHFRVFSLFRTFITLRSHGNIAFFPDSMQAVCQWLIFLLSTFGRAFAFRLVRNTQRFETKCRA